MFDEQQEGQYLSSEEGVLRSGQVYEHRGTKMSDHEKTLQATVKTGFYLKWVGKPMVTCEQGWGNSTEILKW